MSAIAFSVIFAGHLLSVTPSEIGLLIRQLSAPADDDMRYKAAVRLWKYAACPAVAAAFPAIEKAARTDPSPNVRAISLFALGQGLKFRGRPCPEVAFDALADPDIDNVHIAATQVLYWHRPLPPDAEAKLLQFATSGDAARRERGAGLLAEHFPKSEAGLKVIRAVVADPDPMRRHNGFAYLYKSTQKIGDIFPHIMLLQADLVLADEPAADAPEDAKRRYSWLLVVNFGMGQFLADWLQDRPADLCNEVAAALGHESPRVRLAALSLVGRFADVVADPKQIVPPKGTEVWEFQFEPKKLEAGLRALTRAAAVRAKVKALAATDNVPVIRAAAKDVLGKLVE